MKRIMIEWIDNLEGQRDLRGTVYISNDGVALLLVDGAKWRVMVEGQGTNMTIRQEPLVGERYLPKEHGKYSQEVEKLARTYYYGFHKIPEVTMWVE